MNAKFEFSDLILTYLAAYRAADQAFIETSSPETLRAFDVAAHALAVQFEYEAAEKGV